MEENISERIRRLRTAAGLTPGAVALEIRSTSGRAVILNWENGTIPNSRWIAPLADVLSVSSHYLLTGQESEFVGRGVAGARA